MTRTAAYVVLILIAFMFASTSPAWQVEMPVRGNAVSRLAAGLHGPNSRTPSSPVPILWGVDIYYSACYSCHGSGQAGLGIGTGVTGSPIQYAPEDIHRIITWGGRGIDQDDVSYTGSPFELLKAHPAFPTKLTDTERWAVAIYIYSGSLDPGPSENDSEWVDAWNAGLNAPDSTRSGIALYQSLCSTCHGNLGYGNGPLADDLIPPPADLRDTAWLANQSDFHLFMTIQNGVQSMRDITPGEPDSGSGMSWSGMPGWGEILTNEEINHLVNYLRSFSYTMDSFQMREEIHERVIIPDWSQWTWSEIESSLPDAPEEPPEWI